MVLALLGACLPPSITRVSSRVSPFVHRGSDGSRRHCAGALSWQRRRHSVQNVNKDKGAHLWDVMVVVGKVQVMVLQLL